MNSTTTSLLLAASLAIGSTLTSCVTRNERRGATATITTYQPGYRTTSLPRGYRSEVISGSTYYYNNGHYYRPGTGGYVVVDAPRSSRYNSDYDNYRRTSTTYRDSRSNGVSVVTTLPRGYREINHRGSRYYQSGNQYYRRQGSSYIGVSSPY
jgi:hypothetical protein